jgi:hypothetical protein
MRSNTDSISIGFNTNLKLIEYNRVLIEFHPSQPPPAAIKGVAAGQQLLLANVETLKECSARSVHF